MKTWVEISKSKIASNIEYFRSIIPSSTKIIAVTKANAYGHGLSEVGLCCQDIVDYFAVSDIEEAKILRLSGIHIPIIVLSYISEKTQDLLWASQERVEITINSLEQAERISKIIHDSPGGENSIRAHIKIDTGMGRLGIMPQDAAEEIKKISSLPHISVRGVMSHFSETGIAGEYSKKQLQKLEDVRFQLFRQDLLGSEKYLWHISKTESAISMPSSHLDAIRIGGGVYGLITDKKIMEMTNKNLCEAISWKTSITQIKNCEEGEYIGYGCSYKTKKQTKIAIIPVGYYDGYPRSLSSKSEVTIHKKRFKTIGSICMNMTIVDITGADEISTGDEVFLLGEEITTRELSEKAGTISYEITSRINQSIPRIIVE